MVDDKDKIEEKGRPEDLDRPDSVPSFEISHRYQSAYLKSNFESDEYHELITMEEDLHAVVIEKIWKMENFASLKPLEAKNLSVDQEVKVLNEKKAKIIQKINNNLFLVKLNDGSKLEVKLSNIKPLVDPATKLKKAQVQELYYTCLEALKIKNKRSVDIVNFFSVFTGYFEITGRFVFSCLEPKAQAHHLEELKKRTGMTFTKGINPIFRSK